MNTHEYKISFCTVSMNRLHHLQQTLPQNIADNEAYNNLEFIVLDYNSSDNLENYIQSNYLELLETGRLTYYKTTTPLYFNRTHSRNVIFKLATGDILCNIDADNFTGVNFASYINQTFKNNDNIYMRTLRKRKRKDVIGRICVSKNDFYRIRGYDEHIQSYGFEDYDLANRLELAGVKRMTITNGVYLEAIQHVQTESLIHEHLLPNIYKVLFNYISPACIDMIFLFNNAVFKRGTVVNNRDYNIEEPVSIIRKSQLKYTRSILQEQWIKGSWTENNNEIRLHRNNEVEKRLVLDNDHGNFISIFGNKIEKYENISDQLLKNSAIMLLSRITNRIIMDKNLLNNKILTNDIFFGKDIVFKNFDSTPIYT